jgi:vacuolar-type H+-ATPase subunit E/Vma4
MTTLEKIESHILEKTGAEKAQIDADTAAEAREIVEAAHEEADNAYNAAIERTKNALKNAFEHAVGRLEADQRMELLEARTRILEEVFKKATDKLLYSGGYWALTRESLKKVAGMAGRICCRAEHAETIGKMIAELNAELHDKLPPLDKKPLGILGAFVLEGDKFDLDFSLDAQMAAFREKALPEVLAKAFAED